VSAAKLEVVLLFLLGVFLVLFGIADLALGVIDPSPLRAELRWLYLAAGGGLVLTASALRRAAGFAR
jgi:hypothetical protein